MAAPSQSGPSGARGRARRHSVASGSCIGCLVRGHIGSSKPYGYALEVGCQVGSNNAMGPACAMEEAWQRCTGHKGSSLGGSLRPARGKQEDARRRRSQYLCLCTCGAAAIWKPPKQSHAGPTAALCIAPNKCVPAAAHHKPAEHTCKVCPGGHGMLHMHCFAVTPSGGAPRRHFPKGSSIAMPPLPLSVCGTSWGGQAMTPQKRQCKACWPL